jgi:hypothetical protein
MTPLWTDDVIAVAVKLNAAGLSRSQIANEIFRETGMHFSRNAVIGKLARLGHSSPNAPSVSKGPAAFTSRPVRRTVGGAAIVEKVKVRKSAERKAADHEHFTRAAAERRALAPSTDACIAAGGPRSREMPFLDRVAGECGWITSLPGAAAVTVCGCKTTVMKCSPVPKASSYCPYHHGIAYQPPALFRRAYQSGNSRKETA